jgi:hypothetical protein
MKAIAFCMTVLSGSAVIFFGLSHLPAQAETESFPRVASVNLTNAQVLPDDTALVRAFIPTGSKTVKCLVTLNETTFVNSGTQVFCGQRTSALYGPGVLITIDYFQTSVPPDYGTSLTVWQEGAKYYGAPIMCEAAGAC